MKKLIMSYDLQLKPTITGIDHIGTTCLGSAEKISSFREGTIVALGVDSEGYGKKSNLSNEELFWIMYAVIFLFLFLFFLLLMK